jgi:hypothetical protein
MRSLGKAIITPVTSLLAAFCLAASTMSFFLVAFEMNKFLDAQLQEIAINVAPGERRDADPLLDAEHEDQLVVRIWDRSGNLVHRAGPPVDIPWRSQPGLTDVVAEGQEWRSIGGATRNITYRSHKPGARAGKLRGLRRPVRHFHCFCRSLLPGSSYADRSIEPFAVFTACQATLVAAVWTRANLWDLREYRKR